MVFAVFHINNETAKKPTRTRQLLLDFMSKCLVYKVDYMAGDGNMAVNTSFANQSFADRDNSTTAFVVRETQRAFNRNKEIWQRLGVYPIECEQHASLENLDGGKELASEMDSMTGWVFSWSKDILSAVRRSELAEQVSVLRQRQGDLILTGIGTPLSETEQQILDICDPSSSKYQFDDTKISVSEHAKHVTRQDLFMRDFDPKNPSRQNVGGG